ncbi:DUF4129 domain-containing protein [Zafaria sp. J156]|uniref:DUF4129 domain-containing protein n=1 Tax=Zafaria sp. J156 TaxID=3116490 RepID=UPI002E790FC9|nr:DUF4129 domain-containing protein [Zafaria sp. J156]MEE1620318.1 DUF4129 domain-containing protein [Zafaria sp. J156]
MSRLLADAVWEPGLDEARRELVDELSRREYADATPNPIVEFLQRAWEAFLEWIDSLNSLQANLGSVVVLVAVAVIVAVAVLFVRPRLRRSAAPPAAEVGVDTALGAQDYRQRAAAAAVVHDWPTACLERFRAIVRSAEERTLLDEQPGRTAFEVSMRLEAVFPQQAEELDRAALLFNEVHYGFHPASAGDWNAVSALDAALEAAVPSTVGAAGRSALAVPR